MPRDRGRPRITGKPTRPAPSPYRIGLGAATNPNGARFRSAIQARGGTFLWNRLYFQTQSWASMGAISTAAAAGDKVYFSFRPNGTTWEQIAAGNEDARWTGIGNGLAGVANAGAWCFNHEPDNDRVSFGSAANGAAFVAAWERIAGIIKPLAPNWMASINLTEIVFPSYEFGRSGNWAANPDPNDWMSDQMDLLGVDYYWWRGASDGGSAPWATTNTPQNYNNAITNFLSYADAHGAPLCFPEFGSSRRDPALDAGDDARRAAFFQGIADTWAGDSRISSFMYFEENSQDNAAFPNWAITDDDRPPMDTATVQAFVNIGA